jgi:hypothetical protein
MSNSKEVCALLLENDEEEEEELQQTLNYLNSFSAAGGLKDSKKRKAIVLLSVLQYYPLYMNKLSTPRLPNVNRSEQRSYAKRFINTWSDDMFKRQFRICRYNLVLIGNVIGK